MNKKDKKLIRELEDKMTELYGVQTTELIRERAWEEDILRTIKFGQDKDISIDQVAQLIINHCLPTKVNVLIDLQGFFETEDDIRQALLGILNEMQVIDCVDVKEMHISGFIPFIQERLKVHSAEEHSEECNLCGEVHDEVAGNKEMQNKKQRKTNKKEKKKEDRSWVKEWEKLMADGEE